MRTALTVAISFLLVSSSLSAQELRAVDGAQTLQATDASKSPKEEQRAQAVKLKESVAQVEQLLVMAQNKAGSAAEGEQKNIFAMMTDLKVVRGELENMLTSVSSATAETWPGVLAKSNGVLEGSASLVARAKQELAENK